MRHAVHEDTHRNPQDEDVKVLDYFSVRFLPDEMQPSPSPCQRFWIPTEIEVRAPGYFIPQSGRYWPVGWLVLDASGSHDRRVLDYSELRLEPGFRCASQYEEAFVPKEREGRGR